MGRKTDVKNREGGGSCGGKPRGMLKTRIRTFFGTRLWL